MTVRREIGARIIEIDSSVIFTLFENGEYPERDLKINTGEIEKEVKRLKGELESKVKDEVLNKATTLYLAYKEVLQTVDAEGAVFRCAPEIQEKYGLALCGVMSELIDNGVVGKRFKTYSVTELCSEFPELHNPVVDGLFREGETANLIASPKVGKSWLAYDLALSINTGNRW